MAATGQATMDVEHYYESNPRLKVFYLIVGLLVLILTGGLFKVQILDRDEYVGQETLQNQRRILLPGSRGDIRDRENRPLVINRPRFSAGVFLNELRPEFRQEYFRLVREARENDWMINRRELQVEARRMVVQRYLDRINAITGREAEVDPRDIERHFSQNLLVPMELILDLEPEEYARLIEQVPVDSPVQVFSDSARYYPYGSAAAHVLGFVTSSYEVPVEDLPGDELTTFVLKGKKGRSGIERAFDEKLQGDSGAEIWVVDPSGFQYRKTTAKQPEKGDDIITSIDIDLQQAAERALGSRTGAVAAIDVLSGEMLVLASKPDFDLNDLSPYLSHDVNERIREEGAWLNRALQGLYPPGSTFKLVTAIAGLRTGDIDPQDTVHCDGAYRVGNRSFPCHNRAGHGEVDLERAIESSCNVYFYAKGLEIGVKELAETARTFGLDQPTGIELPGESRGMIVPDPVFKRERTGQPWYPGDTANTSIGQGFLLTTPLSMACFTASLARGETHTRPSILHDPQRLLEPSSNRAGLVPIDPEDYGRIIRGMVRAAETGTARLVSIPGVSIAAKTGTAQVRPGGQPLTLAWFVGFAPVEQPRIAIAVMVEGQEPGDNFAGGATAAPIARAVLRTYFDKLEAQRRLPEMAAGQ